MLLYMRSHAPGNNQPGFRKPAPIPKMFTPCLDKSILKGLVHSLRWHCF